MARRTLPPITEAQWQAAVDDYELGRMSGRQIARDLAISPATVSRRMRSRGAEKGSRVEENVIDLLSMLGRKANMVAARSALEGQRKLAIFEANTQAIGYMVAALLEADRQGDLQQAAPAIELVGSAVGHRPKRQSRR